MNGQEVRASLRKQGFSGRAAAAAKLLINVCNLLIILLNCHRVLANPIACQCSCLLPPASPCSCMWVRGNIRNMLGSEGCCSVRGKTILTSDFQNLPYSPLLVSSTNHICTCFSFSSKPCLLNPDTKLLIMKISHLIFHGLGSTTQEATSLAIW